MSMRCRLDVINLFPCDPGFQTGWRVMPYPYLLYVHSGSGRVKIGGRTFAAAMGDMFFCPPQECNAILADETDPYVLSGIEFTCTDGEWLRGALPLSCNLLAEPFLPACVREMVQEYATGLTAGREVCDALLTALTLRLARFASGPRARRDLAADLLAYIRDNLDREVTHEELSRVFHYHKNSVNRLLIQATGMSLKDIRISLRIRKATELLTYSSKPVSEIAELCGYAGASYFSRQYKQKTGRSPLEVRRARRSINMEETL